MHGSAWDLKIVKGAIHHIGKLTPTRLNYPEKIALPIYDITVFNADLYFATTVSSSNGNPPAL